MLKLYCPYCKEEREEIEFHYAGEAFIKRPDKPAELEDEQWADYLFYRDNHKGTHWEQWVHNAACRKYFIAKRNTATHHIEACYRFDKVPEIKKTPKF